nr:MAG TPA: hypothetical protein [Caudoviricetes sp.]
MRHCRRAIAAWPLSFKSQPIRAVIPIALDRSTSGRSFFFQAAAASSVGVVA